MVPQTARARGQAISVNCLGHRTTNTRDAIKGRIGEGGKYLHTIADLTRQFSHPICSIDEAIVSSTSPQLSELQKNVYRFLVIGKMMFRLQLLNEAEGVRLHC